MNILNARLGFATNSSSTHSICFIEDENLPVSIPPDTTMQFGWDNFVLCDQKSKLEYFIALMYMKFKVIVGENTASLALIGLHQQLLKHPKYSEISAQIDIQTAIRDSYIDHQSELLIPMVDCYDKKEPNEQFYMDLLEMFLSPNVVVYGGNDNDEDYFEKRGEKLALPVEVSDVYWRARKDGDVWVLFNKSNGTKLRLSLTGNNVTYTKSTWPELVDISITDYCETNCAFCYRGSTTEGKHASYEFIYELAYMLSARGVFEVALGGGETTSHPKFKEIIQDFASRDVIVNFTTRDLSWIRNLSWVKIIDSIGAFAYSIDGVKNIEELHKVITAVSFPKNKVTVQLIMGTVTQSHFVKILSKCYEYRIPLTLLGYKTTERGANFKPREYSWMLHEILVLRAVYKCPSIGFDTVLVQQFEQELIENNINPKLFNIAEGKTSCFIDAVKKTMGPSSFCKDHEYTSLVVNRANRGKFFDSVYSSY